jgi:hypothetical protein
VKGEKLDGVGSVEQNFFLRGRERIRWKETKKKEEKRKKMKRKQRRIKRKRSL